MNYCSLSAGFGETGFLKLRDLPRSPHGGADRLRAWLCAARGHCAAAAAGLSLQSGAEAGLEAHESLLDLRETPGALAATVQAGWGDGGGHGLLHEAVHPLARVLIQAGFGKQRWDALEAGFVAFSVTVCGIWKDKDMLVSLFKTMFKSITNQVFICKQAELEPTFGVNRGDVAEEPRGHFKDVGFLKLGIASFLEEIRKEHV